MRKLLCSAIFGLLAIVNVNAQDFNLGFNLGLPLGDIKDLSGLNIGVEASYLWDVSKEFDLGLTTGYTTFLGKEGYDALGYLPIAAAARLDLSESIILGVDLGYAIGINPSGVDGGFYYAPKLQYDISEDIDLVLTYKGISANGSSISSLNLGVEFEL